MALGSIPNDIRVPLVYIEIDNSQALTGTPALAQKVLVIGQQLSGGSATPLTLNRITTSESQIDDLYGKGAMLSRTLKQFRKDNQFTDVYALGVEDLAATAAKGEIAACHYLYRESRRDLLVDCRRKRASHRQRYGRC